MPTWNLIGSSWRFSRKLVSTTTFSQLPGTTRAACTSWQEYWQLDTDRLRGMVGMVWIFYLFQLGDLKPLDPSKASPEYTQYCFSLSTIKHWETKRLETTVSINTAWPSKFQPVRFVLAKTLNLERQMVSAPLFSITRLNQHSVLRRKTWDVMQKLLHQKFSFRAGSPPLNVESWWLLVGWDCDQTVATIKYSKVNFSISLIIIV